MTPYPSPEAVITERLRVSLIELITEARTMMRAEGRDPGSVQTWREVCDWLKAKLPEGIMMVDLDDPLPAPETTEKKIRAAADIAVEYGVRRPGEGPVVHA